MSPATTPLPRGRRPRRARYEGFRAYIKRVGTGPKGSADLSFADARAALGHVLDGVATEAQAAAFLVACRIKGESAEELAGFAAALRERSHVESLGLDRPVVVCAGGYDGVVGVPRLSLAAAAIAAGAGAGVVLHGGPSLAPKHGVTAPQVAHALAAPIERLSPRASALLLERTGLTVFWTPRLCPSLERLRPLRDAVGIRTPLNAAEKLLAPLAPAGFMVGVTHMPYAARLLEALRLLDVRRALAVRGIEGSEVARAPRPRAMELTGNGVASVELGMAPLGPSDVEPGLYDAVPEDPSARLGAKASARLTRAILAGHGPAAETRQAVVSAGLGVYAAGAASSPTAAIAAARDALESGAERALDRFVRSARELATT